MTDLWNSSRVNSPACHYCVDPQNCTGLGTDHPNITLPHLCPPDYVADPTNCTGSCLSPGPSCPACTNPGYFHYEKSGVCVHPILRCDMHPQCQYGEDEDDCQEEYRRRGLIPEEATFPCFSPHYYPGSPINKSHVTIWGVRCDGSPTCHRGVDELDCSNGLINTGVLGTHLSVEMTTKLQG